MSKLARVSAIVVMSLALALALLTGGVSAQTVKTGHSMVNHAGSAVTSVQTSHQLAKHPSGHDHHLHHRHHRHHGNGDHGHRH